MPEWPNGRDWKSRVPPKGDRGFESHPLRFLIFDYMVTYKKLYRSKKDRMLAGVCGGIAEYLEIDPVLVRLVMLALIFSGIGIPLYITAWIIIPESPSDESPETAEKTRRTRKNTGIFLIIIGSLLLINAIVPFSELFKFWPVLLILLGLYLLKDSEKS